MYIIFIIIIISYSSFLLDSLMRGLILPSNIIFTQESKCILSLRRHTQVTCHSFRGLQNMNIDKQINTGLAYI